MRKIINYLILLFFIGFLNSCTFNVSNKDNNGDGNQPPAPSNPYPSDGASGISLTPQLSWECNGNNNYNVRFDVYLDTNNQPNNKLVSEYSSWNYTISNPLEENKTYYWKICAKNDKGECESNIWRFTTSGGLLTNGLVAYYPFNGNANDLSSNGNNGQNNGAFLTSDRFNNSNKAYSFNGSNSSILVPHSTSLQPTGGLTLSAWVQLNSLNNTSSILYKGPDTSAGCYSLRYEPAFRTLDFQINFFDYIPGPRITVSSTASLTTYTWYNVIGTFDGSYMKIYLNGYVEGTVNVSNSLGSNYEGMVIGNSFEGNGFNGTLDDIRIYNRALNESEIQQLYHEGGWQKK